VSSLVFLPRAYNQQEQRGQLFAASGA